MNPRTCRHLVSSLRISSLCRTPILTRALPSSHSTVYSHSPLIRHYNKAKNAPVDKKKKKTAKKTVLRVDPAAQSIPDAIHLVKSFAVANFDETVEIAINLDVDPRKANQIVRGVADLPHGSGQKTVIAVFARGAKAEEAIAAGADIVGEQDLATQIQEGKIDFNRCLATPDMMGVVGKVGRILGPRGLMPNPKVGTVTMDLTSAISKSRQGQVKFKTEKKGVVHAAVGKVSFDSDALAENIRSFVEAVLIAKPPGAKGNFFNSCFLSSTQGPGIPVNVRLDPFSQK